MLASLQDILDTVKSNTLTYQQKLMCLGNIAERLFDPRELLGYTDEEWQFLQNQMICDLNECDLSPPLHFAGLQCVY